MRLLLSELTIEHTQVDESALTLKGLVFVVTGSLSHFDGRSALKEIIEQKGGKVTGSVTGKTTCLINNDSASNSAKNKKAKELKVPVLTERGIHEALSGDGRIEKRKNRLGADRSPISGFEK